MLFYNPSDQYSSFDMWAIQAENQWYVYHLQSVRPDAEDVRPINYGYCISKDLMNFTYCGEALRNDEEWEKAIPYAGDVIRRGDKYYMLYSATSGYSNGDGIGLAVSDDLVHWEKYADNPVMQFPDERWYEGHIPGSVTGMINLRDVHFINDICDDEYVYICFAAATGNTDAYRSGCIGLARSRNMTDWEYLPPLYAPHRYTLMEVPRVFRLGDKYILTWLCAPWYGARTDSDMDCRAQHGGETQIHYAVADHPLGPYTLAEQPCMFRGMYSPFVIDPVEQNGKPYLLSTMFRYHDTPADPRMHGGLLPALPLEYREGPVCLFSEELMKYYPSRVSVTGAPIQIPYPQCSTSSGRVSFTDAALCALPLTQPMMRTVAGMKLHLTKGRAGLLIRYNDNPKSAFGVLYDRKRNEIEFVRLSGFHKAFNLFTCERHPAYAACPDEVQLQVIAEKEHILVFVDGALRGTYSFPSDKKGSFGLLVENASGFIALDDWYTSQIQ